MADFDIKTPSQQLRRIVRNLIFLLTEMRLSKTRKNASRGIAEKIWRIALFDPQKERRADIRRVLA
jgi:hypothetical protein